MIRVLALLAFVALHLAGADQPAQDWLRPGDLVEVAVYGHPDLTVSMRVPGHGVIVLPLIGEVRLGTKSTPEALAHEVTTRLEADFLQKASVTVSVREYGRFQVYVFGSVARPGQVDLPRQDRLTALRAISSCGGFLEEANIRGVTVVREVEGKPQALPLGPNGGAADLAVEPGDLILVPRLDRAYVLGQVTKPGPITLPGGEGLLLSKALSIAGGMDRYAKEDSVLLLRPGQPSRTIDAEAVLRGEKGSTDPTLAPGDTVYVPTRRF